MAETTLVADKTGNLRMSPEEKEKRYRAVAAQIRSVLKPETDLLASMCTVVCLLHNAFPYYFWTGFYRRVGPDLLRVGPYQGTMGCIDIPFSRGVCGAAAREARTQVVEDVHAFPGHIACDAASASEIVVPVLGAAGEVIAVLDVDSTIPAAFDEVDRRHLEEIVSWLAEKDPLPVVATA
jgi:L-methionine (R)-S-oxide reductase